ncbi:GPP34 family phosphoprotein [Nonomuraea jabiensis]|uniref:GOLPH3/VPS74 family protein n=1 Tax=Nonomuraea jabiensis TaxID=882448 RepID=UPI00343A3167
MSVQQLALADELILLAHREGDGKQLIPNNVLNISLTAAELAELAALGRLKLRGADLAVVDRQPVGDAQLDSVLSQMGKVGKALPPSKWLIRINPLRKGRHYLQRLAERGAFKAGNSRVMGLFPIERYEYDDTELVRELTGRLGQVVRGRKPDARTVTLLALTYHSGVLRQLFAIDDEKRIGELVRDDWAGQAVKTYVDKTTRKAGDSGDMATLLAAGGSSTGLS